MQISEIPFATRSLFFEIRELPGVPEDTFPNEIHDRATPGAEVAPRGQRTGKGAPGEGREAASATASGVPYRPPLREP